MRLAEQTDRLAAAAAPLLLDSLVVGDLARAEQTMRNLNTESVWSQILLYESDGRRVIFDASPKKVRRSHAPRWLKQLVPVTLDEHRVAIAAAPVTYGILAVTPSVESLENELWTEVRTMIAVTGVLLVTLLGLTHVILLVGLRPVRALAESATRLGHGDLTARMPETKLSEMRPTVRAFNSMADSLERSRHIGAVTPANSPLYGVKLDIHVETAPELQMKTAVARLSGDADLRIRGSAARPSLLGRADVLEGEATFNGTKFRLERGDITFANPVTIEPLVNLQASTHVRNYDLNITVTGSPDRLAVNYRSEPPLPKSDIIALLALGRTSEESQQLQQQSGQSPFNDEASAMIINQAINSTVSSRMQKLFGVSRIKIDPQGLTTETNPTARGPQVTIEQQFANNVSLTYSTNVSQSSQQIIQGEYFFTRSISLVGTRDQNGVVSFDVRIRRQKK